MANLRVGRRSLAFRGGRGRLTEWMGRSLSQATSLGASAFIIDSSLSALELAKRPFTITRLVGSLYVASDQSAAFEFPFGAFGGIVVSDKALALGATAVPDPITQTSSDEWFMIRSFGLSGNPEEGRVVHEFMFDSKAQRKVQDGDDVAFVMSNGSSAAGVSFVARFRMLVKLS